MNALRNTCVLSLTLAAALAAQVSPHTPVLRPGVSVEMAATKNAVPLPQADEENARVVAVTAAGKVYLDVQPARHEDLARQLKGTASIYVKADTRASFAVVAQVLEGLRQAGLSAPLLLTSQNAKAEAGRPVPPFGLAVHTGSVSAAGSAIQTAVQAPASASYGEVVHVIDACRGAGSVVVLILPSTAR